MSKEEETHQKTDVKPAENSKEQKPKSIRRQVCCCLSILGAFFALALFVSIGMFCGGGESKVPVFNTNKTTTAPKTTTQTKTYPAAGSCEPLSAPSVLPLGISADNPGLHEKTDNHYYQIYAYTKNDIYNQINACGPNVDGQSYFGLSKSQINWTYKYDYIGDNCNVRDVAVGVHVEIYYPKWDAPGNAESGLAAKWDDYMPKLVLHEEGHRDNAVTAGNQILNAISSLPTLSCATMQDQVDTVADNIIVSYNATDVSYDDTTNHGETQGADF